ncbi:MAG: anhydro-N-acetylmuramic acid kinase [Nitrospinota bacterium]|jgi:anhydro-N-acetylmuramic acid kinase|nr:anhydro-N-acetylmuramic acid kinase [Nitrospinota bacterium]MDP7387024.1 anhydro-N-acetylmuramic acid kinase [Nitrospinota bacterium]HJM43954.1 anhydro-N-acetylmuramic acid kinase [Nitrospinota bacterium]
MTSRSAPISGRTSSGKGLFIGLMSGTSADGVEASLISVSRSRRAAVRLLAHRSFLFSKGLRERILRVSETPVVAGRPITGQSTADLTALHYDLGERFAAAAVGVAAAAGIRPADVTAVGSHGQTVCHRLPPPPVRSGRIGATLQIGEPAVIAERTGVTVVADFRPGDMAAGGLGAPLTPYAHGLLFGRPDRPVLVVNLGGIGNVTWAPAGFDPEGPAPSGRAVKGVGLKGFDTGPANMLLDAAVRKFSRGKVGFDRNGETASRGAVDEKLLGRLLAHPFIRRGPPKATGREDFGADALEGAVRVFLGLRKKRAMRFRSPLFCDFMATLAAFTTRSIGRQVRRFLPEADEVVVCGGGAENPVLMKGLAAEFPDARVVRSDARGVPAHAVEGVSFALLARAALLGVPANVPAVTGASRPVVLGKILPAAGATGSAR